MVSGALALELEVAFAPGERKPDPEHAVAKQRLVEIGRVNAANRMFAAAEHLLRNGEIEDARRMIETGLKMNPEDERLLGLKRALE